jgi:2,3-dihydroxy-2,3-dihydro-p-cumate dehydrogenase
VTGPLDGPANGRATGPLDGRAAIVTGGATGIGLGITRRLLADGAHVLVSVLDKAHLGGTGLDGVPSFVGDLSQPGVADSLLAAAVDSFGVVDVLVNNAGGGVIRPTLEHTEETLQATIDNNLWTTLRATLAVLPHMAAHGGGRIINIGAESVRNGLTDHAVYNAAKGGVHAMAVGLAREFATAGITVNTVAPSYVETPELAAAIAGGGLPERFRKVLTDAVELIPMGRPGTVEDVAGMVAYLAGPDAAFVTGQTLSLNGGSSMG